MKARSLAYSWCHRTTAGTSSRAITRFSATVMLGTSVKCWYTMPMPSAWASCGESIARSRTPTTIWPASGW